MTLVFVIAFVLLWVVVLFESFVLFGLVQRLASAAEAATPTGAMSASGRLIGQPVPGFAGRDLDDEPFDESSLPNRLSALLFVTPDCVSCMATLEELHALEAKVGGSLFVVCRGAADDCRFLREEFRLDRIRVILDDDRMISKAFDVVATPTAVLIGSNGRIRTYGHPVDQDELGRMMANASREPELANLEPV